MSENGFAFQYAIRLPNGSLYSHPKATQQVEDYSVPSPMRDMYQFMGLSSPSTPSAPPKSGPVIFDTQQAADERWIALCEQAAAVGVELWGGVVVKRLCTPFTSGDPAVDFAQAVVGWVEQQGGAS